MGKFENKIATTLLALTLSVAIFPRFSSADSIEQKKIDNLKQKIEDKQKDLKQSKKRQKKIYRDLKKSERAISKTNLKLNNIANKQKKIHNDLKKLEKRARVVRKNIDAEKRLLERFVYHLYVNEDTGATALKILLGPQKNTQKMREIRYLSYISKSRKKIISNLRGSLKDLAKITDEKKATESKLLKIKTNETVQKKKLLEEKKKKREILSKVKGDIKRTEKALKNDERILNKKIRELARAAKKREAKTGISNTQLPDSSLDGKAFRKLKGKLRLPTVGVLKHRYGTRREGDILWKGVFIDSKLGQPVKAIASGQVVFADWLGGFGNLLIIDHGGGYLSLYGNNESLLEEVGNTVKAGETVGTVGNTGGNRNSGLYFELRYKGKPFNPLKWVKL